jgi:hypothetical protein
LIKNQTAGKGKTNPVIIASAATPDNEPAANQEADQAAFFRSINYKRKVLINAVRIKISSSHLNSASNVRMKLIHDAEK